MKHVQDPPFCIQVEMTEGCNLYCNFCGLTGIREKSKPKFKFMTLNVAHKVAARIKDTEWNCRIEFAQHGEPTMNPNFTEIVRIFREHLPNNQLMMTSNGGGLLKDTVAAINELFNSGLNILALDSYESVAIVPKIMSRLSNTDVRMYEYPSKEVKISPHGRWPKGTNVVLIVKDISVATRGNHSTLSNHCGAASRLSYSRQEKKCAKPFREMSIHWDGHIKACCQDWFGILVPGNAVNTPISDVWQGGIFSAMRKKLYHGQRDFAPCYGCDYITYRNGLLPDQRGKRSLPKPSKNDNDTLKKAVRKPTNKPVSVVAKETIKEWKKCQKI